MFVIGAVAVEFAAQLASDFTQPKKVTLVHDEMVLLPHFKYSIFSSIPLASFAFDPLLQAGC